MISGDFTSKWFFSSLNLVGLFNNKNSVPLLFLDDNKKMSKLLFLCTMQKVVTKHKVYKISLQVAELNKRPLDDVPYVPQIGQLEPGYAQYPFFPDRLIIAYGRFLVIYPIIVIAKRDIP